MDTSALMAIVLDEPKAGAIKTALAEADRLLISAATVAEAHVVAGRRGRARDMHALMESLDFAVVDVTAETALDVAAAYTAWGKGNHPARLNYGDCFAYVLAKARNAPLLYIGDDFARTDIAAAL